MTLIDLCRRLTSIDSSVSHGTRHIVEEVATLAREWGLPVDIEHDMFGGVANANVFIRPRGSERRQAEKELLLVSHLDTVDPGDYVRWTRTGANPFNASFAGESIYGLGVADAKADFACKLFALHESTAREYSALRPTVVGTYGISSGAGAIRMIRRKSVNPSGALVGAPTGMSLATKGPGFAKVEISVPFGAEERAYREKHNLAEGSISQSKIFSRRQSSSLYDQFAANPVGQLLDYLTHLPTGFAVISLDAGVNAESDPDSAYLELDMVDGLRDSMIQRLGRVGQALKRLEVELRTVSDEACKPTHSTMSIGAIRSLPEEVRLYGICRLVPAQGRDVYRGWLEKLRQDCAATGAVFHLMDFKPPFETAVGGPLFDYLKSVSSNGNSLPIVAAGNCTEANVFQRLGVESLVFGPGKSDVHGHSAEDFVNEKDMFRAKDFYKGLIERYCR